MLFRALSRNTCHKSRLKGAVPAPSLSPTEGRNKEGEANKIIIYRIDNFYILLIYMFKRSAKVPRARTLRRKKLKRYMKTYKKGVRDYIVKSTPIQTPFPDEFICKMKSFVMFDLQGLGGAQPYSDARIDNSLKDLGSYQPGTGAIVLQPVGGQHTQEGMAQMLAMYDNYVVTGIKVDFIIENNNNHSIILYSWPYYPGTNYTGPTIPFTGFVEDDPRVAKKYINPANQGASKICKLKRYISPQYAFNNGYIKGDKGWAGLIAGNPDLNFGLAMRVASTNRTSVLNVDTHVTGYITHYVKFFNKKNT